MEEVYMFDWEFLRVHEVKEGNVSFWICIHDERNPHALGVFSHDSWIVTATLGQPKGFSCYA